MNQPDLFTPQETGEQRRDRGMQKVLSHEEPTWEETALVYLRNYVANMAGEEFTAQNYRTWYVGVYGGQEPRNPNAWGAFWAHAVRRGIVEHTGRTVKATMPQSNATRLAVYRGKR